MPDTMANTPDPSPDPMTTIQLRVRDSDLHQIDVRAQARGMTRTEYLKLAGLGRLDDSAPPPGAVRAHNADPARHGCPRCGALTVQWAKGKRKCSAKGCTWAGAVTTG